MPSTEMPSLPLYLTIVPALHFLLKKQWRERDTLFYPLSRRASIKDVLEAIGIPHTEIGSLTKGDRELDFGHIPEPGDSIEVGDIAAPFEVDRPSLLRPETISRTRFLADINVGKLAALLRMAGMDTALYPGASDEQLAHRAAAEKRILLTRDHKLLCRSIVQFGRLLRVQTPYEQLREIIDFFGLEKFCRPFSRCMKCNGLLQRADKADILHLLEPKTKLYYHLFRRCRQCGTIYWQGSHRRLLRQHLDTVGLAWLAKGEEQG